MPATAVWASAPRRAIACTVAAAVLVSGCSTVPGTPGGYLKDTFANDDPCANSGRNVGLAAGLLAGAIVGAVVADNKKVGALIGAGIGTALGGLIGADIDRRRCELSRIARKHGLDMTVVEVSTSGGQPGAATAEAKQPSEGLSVSITDAGEAGNGQFATGSADLLPEARAYFFEIAQQYSYAAQSQGLRDKFQERERARIETLKSKRILLVGHTDDAGGSAYNADLSERRARAVAAVFREAGVGDNQLFYQGAGETLPLADNHTELGRAKNRRVEIVDLTDDASFTRFLESRRPNLAFYRSAAESGGAPRVASDMRDTPTSRPAGTASGSKPPTVSAARRNANADRPNTHAHAQAHTRGEAEADTATPVSRGATAVAVTKTAPMSSRGPNQSAPVWNFGGTPTRATPASMDIGKLERSTGLSLISSAMADAPVPRCDLDRPRVANAVKSLKDDKMIRTGDYMPGLYNTSWTDRVNGNLVALTGVAVLRDGGSPARRPTLLIYRDYRGDKQAADLRVVPEVNTYRGDKALLYRVFVNQAAVQCLDVVIPHASPDHAQGSWLRYDNAGQSYSAAFNPQLVRLR